MPKYVKKFSKYKRKYNLTLKELTEKLKVSHVTIMNWDRCGFDIFEKSKNRIYNSSFNGISKLSNCWHNMLSRCGNPNDIKYKNYGGKGIKVKLDRRQLFELWTRDKADQMKRPSIDRINSDGHYEFSNCRFIEMSENIKRRWHKITLKK